MKTILVIDDSKHILELVSDVLDSAGYNVVLTMEPDRAISLCEQINFDAVLCDLYMKEEISERHGSLISGMNVLWKLVDRHPRLPIIAMSGNVDEELVDKLKKWGVRGAVNKPFAKEKLLKEVMAIAPLQGAKSSHPV